MLATIYLYLEISNVQFYLIIEKKNVSATVHCGGLKTNRKHGRLETLPHARPIPLSPGQTAHDTR